MRSFLTRRSFIKKTSAGLTGAALAAAGTSSLYANVGGKNSTPALLGGTPVRTKAFDSTWPIFDENEEKALLKALRSRNWCCLKGSAVYDFEKEFAQAMGVPHCVLSNGGTTALSASLHCLGVGPGDEVITTPNTFIATINKAVTKRGCWKNTLILRRLRRRFRKPGSKCTENRCACRLYSTIDMNKRISDCRFSICDLALEIGKRQATIANG